MIERFIPPSASHVAYAEWDDVSEDFLITFDDGSNYLIRNVPRATYRGLTVAESPGAYYWRVLSRMGAERVPFATLEDVQAA